MDIFEMIKQEIMADPMNDYYTRDGISPYSKRLKCWYCVIAHQTGKQKITVIQ